MRVVLALAQLTLGGTETYSVTVAEQLERLGHPTRLHAGSTSEGGRELAATRGVRLTVGEPGALSDAAEIDAVVAQDQASAYALAARCPGARQIFVVHGLAPYEQPPGALRPLPTVVALNDRIVARASAHSSRPEIARLRQPIDIERFRPRTPSRPRARRLLVLSNYLGGDRLRLLEEVCGDLGLELARVGAPATRSVEPQGAIDDADIVVGYGRSVLEGMAMGRAAYVWDRGGGDGWVTPESYAAMEADGFSGAATDAVVDRERLRSDLAAYRPALGTLGFDLVRKHHSAAKHADALVALLERADGAVPDEGFDALALSVRAEMRTAVRANGLEWELGTKADQIEALRTEASSAHALAAAERARRLAAEGQLEALLSSRSWRLTKLVRSIGRRLRSIVARRWSIS